MKMMARAMMERVGGFVDIGFILGEQVDFDQKSFTNG
jgi:hypothetical protein